MNNEPARTAAGAQVLNLPLLLNILYRGRWWLVGITLAGVILGAVYGLVATPRYLGTVQVRPGIVAYSDVGGPVREWALKDIVHWFRSGLYAEVLTNDPRFDAGGVPMITAEFIPSGPSFERGGDIITLNTFDPDPARARLTLALAIDAFNGVGLGDSAAATLVLTRGGARVRMEKLRNDLELIVADEERTELRIAQHQRQLVLLDATIEHADRRLERLTATREVRRRAVGIIGEEIAAGRLRLAEAESLLVVALAAEGGSTVGADGRVGDNDAVTELLLQTASREQAGRVGDLLRTVADLESRVYRRTLEADAVRDEISGLDLDLAAVRLEREVDLPKQRRDVEQIIAEARIELARELPHRRSQLEADLAAEQVRLDLLVPLERLGRIVVTDGPVRPRRLRATLILAFLAAAGAVFLVLVREYYRRNRDAILAGPDAG